MLRSMDWHRVSITAALIWVALLAAALLYALLARQPLFGGSVPPP
jgi:hypothetical protein